MEPESILVVRLSALGDVLFTLPAVQAVQRRFPNSRIDWVVEDRAASILDLVPGLGNRIVYPRRELSGALRSVFGIPRAAAELFRHARRLRSCRYDVVLDFQGNLKSGVHRQFARGRRKARVCSGAISRNSSSVVQPKAR